MQKIMIIIAVFILSGCARDSKIGEEHKRLCALDAGVTINKTVSAEGFYQEGASGVAPWQTIMFTRYDFIEVCDDDPSPYIPLGEPGCWRVSRIERSSGRCNAAIDSKLRKKKAPRYVDFVEDHCIYAEKLEQPTARYGQLVKKKQWEMEHKWNPVFIRYDQTVVEMETGEVLARAINYRVNPKPEHPIAPVMYGCEKYGYDRGTKLWQRVIKPS